MQITVCRPDEVPTLLPEALAGRLVLAPVEPGATATLEMLRPDVPVEHPDAAVVVSTSGSTGTPKGVVLSRQALLAAAEAAQQVLGPMRWTCPLPTGYVAGLMVLVRAHVAGTAVRFAGSNLADLEPTSGPGATTRSAISIVPTQLYRALERPDVLRSLARFDAILLGGAAAGDELLGRAQDAGLHVVTTYGMSETCGGCVWDGVPLPGVEVDLAQRDSPERGRISLAGPMVFSGYRLAPELTADSLRSTPDGRPRVLTQDRGAWRDGRLQVLGRLDDVVTSGGVNVDLASVRRAVEAVAPGRGAVVAVPDAEWGNRVVLATTDEHPLAWWRSRLSGPLGREALPRQLVGLEVLPRTSSGKIDRQALERLALADGPRPATPTRPAPTDKSEQ